MSKHNKNHNHPNIDQKHTDPKIEINENVISQESSNLGNKTTVNDIKEQTIEPNNNHTKQELANEDSKIDQTELVSKNSEDMILDEDYVQLEKPASTEPKPVSDVETNKKVETTQDYIYDNNEPKSNNLLLKTIFLIAIISILGYIIMGGNFLKPSSSTSNLAGSSKIDKKPCLANNAKMNIPANLKIEDTLVGTGKEVFSGCEIKIHYKGYLVQTQQEIDEKMEPKEFDNSFKRGAPFSTQIGVGKLIKGWDIGIIGMKEGGKRKLTIPSDLAYGDIELPGIPAKSTLVFEVELIQVLD